MHTRITVDVLVTQVSCSLSKQQEHSLWFVKWLAKLGCWYAVLIEDVWRKACFLNFDFVHFTHTPRSAFRERTYDEDVVVL